MEDVRFRRLILRELYEQQRLEPQGYGLEQSQLIERLEISREAIQFNINYLLGKELVEPIEHTIWDRTYHFVKITSIGIDLVEDPNEFNNRFPPQVVVQTVLGDQLKIDIGDNASNVSVGKDINQVIQFGAKIENIEEIGEKFTQEFQVASDSDQNNSMQIKEYFQHLMEIFKQDEIDLGEVQRIKRDMSELEGRPAVRTALLFSHDAVKTPIQKAVEQLIGYTEGSKANEG